MATGHALTRAQIQRAFDNAQNSPAFPAAQRIADALDAARNSPAYFELERKVGPDRAQLIVAEYGIAAGTTDFSKGQEASPAQQAIAHIAFVNTVISRSPDASTDLAAVVVRAEKMWSNLGTKDRALVATNPAAIPAVLDGVKPERRLAPAGDERVSYSENAAGGRWVNGTWVLGADTAFAGRMGNDQADERTFRSSHGLRANNMGNGEWSPASSSDAGYERTSYHRAGLDATTARALIADGFSEPQILAATGLTKDLGISLKGHVAEVARLKRDVKDIEPSMRKVKSITDSIADAEANAAEARERGDDAAAKRHTETAERLRRERQKLIDDEDKRIGRECPSKPGRRKDWRNVTRATTAAEAEIDADAKAGRITPQQAGERWKRISRGNENRAATQRIAMVRAERAASHKPGKVKSKPVRVAKIKAIEDTKVKPEGRVVADAGFADAFEEEAPAPPQSADAAPAVLAPDPEPVVVADATPDTTPPVRKGKLPSGPGGQMTA